MILVAMDQARSMFQDESESMFWDVFGAEHGLSPDTDWPDHQRAPRLGPRRGANARQKRWRKWLNVCYRRSIGVQ